MKSINKSFNEVDNDFYDLEYFLSLEYRYLSGAHASRVNNIFKRLDNLKLKGKHILDVGCGGGFITNKILQLGGRVTGCDYSQYAIKFAEERYPKLKINKCSAYEIGSLEVNDLDLITAFDVVEHLAHPEIFFRNSFKILKRGGRLIVGTDNENYIFLKHPFNHLKNILMKTSSSGRAYQLIKKVEAPRRHFKDYHQSHINTMSIDNLLKRISKVGFQIEEIAVFPIVSIPLLDFFSKFLPLFMRGDYQLITAVKG